MNTTKNIPPSQNGINIRLAAEQPSLIGAGGTAWIRENWFLVKGRGIFEYTLFLSIAGKKAVRVEVRIWLRMKLFYLLYAYKYYAYRHCVWRERDAE
jgi:hypothetical protein